MGQVDSDDDARWRAHGDDDDSHPLLKAMPKTRAALSDLKKRGLIGKDFMPSPRAHGDPAILSFAKTLIAEAEAIDVDELGLEDRKAILKARAAGDQLLAWEQSELRAGLRAELDVQGFSPRAADLLAELWPWLEGGSQTKMAPWKIARLERVVWNPPELTFELERHGGTVQGSTRGDLQTWTVDLDRLTAAVATTGRRQLHPTASRFNARPVAERIARSIAERVDHAGLRWENLPGRDLVRVLVAEIVPDDSFKQTVQGRRKRLREELKRCLEGSGWTADEGKRDVWRGPRSTDEGA